MCKCSDCIKLYICLFNLALLRLYHLFHTAQAARVMVYRIIAIIIGVNINECQISDQPNGGGDCVEMLGLPDTDQGQWDDQRCDRLRPAMCKKSAFCGQIIFYIPCLFSNWLFQTRTAQLTAHPLVPTGTI